MSHRHFVRFCFILEKYKKSEAFTKQIAPSLGCTAFNHLTPNGHYMFRTAQLTSRRCILYIYSTNIRTEYFKHAA